VVSAVKSAAQQVSQPADQPPVVQAVPPAIRAAADKIKQEYLAQTYPMLSAVDKDALQSTELGKSFAKLGESLQISEQFLEDAALIAAYGPEFGFMFSQKVPVKVRIIHSSCTKRKTVSRNIFYPAG